MKVYLINRRDVAVFQGEKQLCVKRKGGAEFVEPVAADGEEVTLRFYRRSEFAAKNWWLYVMFFWIIGICGICTPRYGKFVHALDCKVKFTADETGASICGSRIISTKRDSVRFPPWKTSAAG